MMGSCQACHKPVPQEDLVQFWQFNICYDCNRILAGKLRETTYRFIGVPAPKVPGQMELALRV